MELVRIDSSLSILDIQYKSEFAFTFYGKHGWIFYYNGHGIHDASNTHITNTHPIFWAFGKF